MNFVFDFIFIKISILIIINKKMTQIDFTNLNYNFILKNIPNKLSDQHIREIIKKNFENDIATISYTNI